MRAIILTPAKGEVTITPQQSCGYVYERREGDPSALRLTSAVTEVPFPGVILEYINLASTEVTITHAGTLRLKNDDNSVKVPAKSYLHICMASSSGNLTETTRISGGITDGAAKQWLTARARQTAVPAMFPAAILPAIAVAGESEAEQWWKTQRPSGPTKSTKQ